MRTPPHPAEFDLVPAAEWVCRPDDNEDIGYEAALPYLRSEPALGAEAPSPWQHARLV